jgi:hypothetical protein
MHEKKGQITLFIIIGIILLLGAALIFYLKEQDIIFRPKPPVLPDDASQIKQFVETCVSSIAKDAANLVGTTGGYIKIPDEIRSNPMASVRISPLENGKIPYWHYQGESRIPPLEFIEEQISGYVTDNIRECILDLEPFRTQYNIKELGNISTTTTITEEAVAIEVDYPIEISDKLGRKITSLDKFSSSVSYRLKQTYDFAVNIMEEENRAAKLEDITVDLLAMDSDIPYAGFEFSCSDKKWEIEDIKDKIKLLLRTDLPLIRIDRTNFRPVPEDQPYVLNHYIWDVSNTYYPSIKASFTYDDSWPLYMYIRPNRGSYVSSNMQKGADLTSWLCMQSWKFTYDILYPVTATVYDKKSDYTFRFAFEVMIDHNMPSRNAYAVSSFEFATNPREEEFCERRVNDITVYTYENVSENGIESYLEIDDVNLTFTCLKYTCNIGATKFKGPVAVLTEKFPYCVWGILRGYKDGYRTGEEFIAADRESEAKIYLTPLKKISNYTVVKHELTYDENEFTVSPEEKPLSSGETATITIENDNQKTFGMYPREDDMPLELLAYADFNYKVQIYISNEDNIIGGYIANWTASWNELENADNIVFHAVYMPQFKDEAEQFAFVSGLGQYSAGAPAIEIN